MADLAHEARQLLEQHGAEAVFAALAAGCRAAAAATDPGKSGRDTVSRRWDRAADAMGSAAVIVAIAEDSGFKLADALGR